MTITDTTPLNSLTVGELKALIISMVESGPRTVHGIKGLASILDCSESTAKRIKASGVLDRAICQSGRFFTVDVQMAKCLWAKATHGRTFKNA